MRDPLTFFPTNPNAMVQVLCPRDRNPHLLFADPNVFHTKVRQCVAEAVARLKVALLGTVSSSAGYTDVLHTPRSTFDVNRTIGFCDRIEDTK